MYYFDNNATTKIDNDVLSEFYYASMGLNLNPSAIYANHVVNEIEKARKYLADLINANPDEIYFTSCGTEANNWVIKSFNRILSSRIEHKSIINSVNRKEYFKADVNKDGEIILKDIFIGMYIKPDLVSIMLANNETGTIQPVKQIVAKIKKENKNILIHTDAIQAVGKIKVDVKDLGIDFMSISGHKFHAPKGIGALYIKKGCEKYLINLLDGGGQEKGIRSGTENVAGIIAMGKASQIANCYLENNLHIKYIKKLRDDFERFLKIKNIDFIVNGGTNRLPNTSNISIKNFDALEFIKNCAQHDIYLSSMSACNNKKAKKSYVLEAMEVSDDYIFGTLRVSLSKFNTYNDIRVLVDYIKEYMDGKIYD